jgi:hypothetical protein
MAIATLAQRNALATAYGTAAPNGALFTADPGTTGTVTGEVNGGSPAYARKGLSWGTAAASAITSAATAFDVPTGTTITYFGVTVSATAATADLRDRVAVTSQAFASQGTYTVTATYTQT